ncbi:MAG: glycosyl hydrolase [Saprospiraceae bacterium]|nr:glycosyl hydrolase [Saprospiraceae bacterium]
MSFERTGKREYLSIFPGNNLSSSMKNSLGKILLICLLFILNNNHTIAQQKKSASKSGSQIINSAIQDSLFHGMKWRNIGPFRGGRVTTVCGVQQDPFTYYFGSTGGGVWKTVNAGASWINVSDGYFKTGSVGAIAVAPSDPNVIYVGMGEAPIRGVMTSHGDGVYRSTDAGKTWEHIGLERSRQISKIQVHPDNPDLAYVSVQGSPYQPTPDRGIYLTKDGGSSWTKIHEVDESSGACDLSMDMKNPRILYAAYWDHQRLPWQMRSGGKGSGIWKTRNAGETWEKLSEGLPDSLMGKIGVCISPANNNRLYAIIESEQGGLYRSDDAGVSWKLINDQRILRARSWYYMHVFADPVDEDKVMVLNAPFMQSTDAGRTFSQINTPHGDNHALWINPDNPQIMINGNDGGANVSFNGGKNWSTQANQPTAQFYRVNADNRFPYYVYGGQQDNSTVAWPSASTGNGIPFSDFYSVGGCESAYTAFDPDDPRFVYSGCYQGIITEYDTKLKLQKDIMAYPDLGLGQKPSDMRYRYNWNAPILMSRHDRKVIYHAGNQLLKTTDRGITWEEISPDLTRNIKENQIYGGGPITNEGAGGENYHTIMSLAESPLDPEVIWVGSDDGLVHITRNGGTDWLAVTPPKMQEGLVNCIEASPHEPGTAYVAYTRYKFNDFSPHVFITHDFGASWQDLASGIEDEAHVRVVREDPVRPGLLYAGTETGLFISHNGGNAWSRFQLNLPVVAITDLKVHHNDLIAATAGRSFWILDDLEPLQNWDEKALDNIRLFHPMDAVIWGGPRKDTLVDLGTNLDFGLMAYFQLPGIDPEKEIKFVISNQEGEKIKAFSNKEKLPQKKLTIKKSGINKLVWNLVPDGVEPIKGLITLGGNTSPKVGLGRYQLTMVYGTDTLVTGFNVIDDPRLEVSAAAKKEKEDWLEKLDLAARDLTESVKAMNYVKEQIEGLNKRLAIMADTALYNKGKDIISGIDSLKNTLVQTKQKTFQDVINFPNQLDAKIRHIQSILEQSYPPVTNGQTRRAGDVMEEWKTKKEKWLSIQSNEIKSFNLEVEHAEIPFISTKIPKKQETKP